MKKEKENTRRSFLKNAAAGALAAVVSPAVLKAETIMQPIVPSGAQAGAASAVSVLSMKTEYMVNPLGIDVARPRFSWVLGSTDRGGMQTAYRVIVASGERNIRRNRGDIWDSGKIRSSVSVGIVYNGPSLQSKKRYWWKIMVWNKADRASDWSEPAWFEMGILKASEWTGQWIGGDGTGDAAPYLRKEFDVDAGKTVSRARLYISACAYYVAYINGDRVGDNVLDPGYTVYNKTNLYVTHDVTTMIKSGTNCIGAEVGKGFYQSSMPDWNISNAPWKGEPRMLAMLEVTYRDGSSSILTSDNTWKSIGGPCYFNDIFIGDSYDARNEKPGWNTVGYNDADWPNAREAGSPGGVLRAQMLPPMKIVDTINPVAVTSPAPGIFVFDFGVNVTGWEVLSASAPAGTKIKIKSGEKLDKAGRVRAAYKIEQQEDYYTFKGTGIETWEPSFCYHGYQYVEVSGFPGTLTLANIKGIIIHSTVDSVGSFTCSNDLFNKIHENVRRTILNNLHSIPTDTPIYEKNGWTGDAHLILETSIYNFDMNRFYTKWEYDGNDLQRPNGQVPLFWPNADSHYWPFIEWTGVYFSIPYMLWQFYGDTGLMGDLYPNLKKSATWFMDHHSAGYGDWLPPDGNKEGKDPGLTAGACIFSALRMMKEIAAELGHKADSEEWNNALTSKISSFNSTYWNATNGYFQDKPVFRQTNQVAPLGYGAVIDSARKSSMLKALVNDIEVKRDGHIWTGCIGTKFFWPVLTENGYGDIAYIAANKTDFPSYGEQINAGATTCWEGWGLGTRSRNHFFFGTIDQWFYEYLAGIRPTAPGFKSISIKPYIPGDLTSAAGQVTTVHGDVISRWNIEVDGTFTFRVSIPTNTSAEISIPKRNYNSNWVVHETKGCCWKSNAYMSGVQGITSGKDDGDFVMFQVGSGDYLFRVGEI
jgi:alpha-L-rhamnosidase